MSIQRPYNSGQTWSHIMLRNPRRRPPQEHFFHVPLYCFILLSLFYVVASACFLPSHSHPHIYLPFDMQDDLEINLVSEDRWVIKFLSPGIFFFLNKMTRQSVCTGSNCYIDAFSQDLWLVCAFICIYCAFMNARKMVSESACRWVKSTGMWR